MIQQRWLPLAWVVMVVQLLSHSQTEWLLVPMGLVWPSLTGFNHCRPFVMPIAAILVPVVAAAAAVTSIAFIFCSDVVVPTAYSNFHYVLLFFNAISWCAQMKTQNLQWKQNKKNCRLFFLLSSGMSAILHERSSIRTSFRIQSNHLCNLNCISRFIDFWSLLWVITMRFKAKSCDFIDICVVLYLNHSHIHNFLSIVLLNLIVYNFTCYILLPNNNNKFHLCN